MRKHWIAVLMMLVLLAGAMPAAAQETYADAVQIVLSDDGVTVDGQPASTDSAAAVYTAHDIVFYLAGQDFTYGEGTETEGHTQEEADTHTVVHITQPGTYVLSGSLSSGQVAVEIKEGKEDPEAVVTLVLNGVDVTCSVAPAVIFYDVYECGSADAETATYEVDTAAAGANVIIADDTVNNVTGSHVARIYEPGTVELSEDGKAVKEAQKLHKYDAAFYSRRTMNVAGGAEGSGVLNIFSDNEGLDSELHLTINGGQISIVSGNDGINTNEDNVSVTTVNGGHLSITVNGSTGEGDGIDSNGWLVLNGGVVDVSGCGFSGDAGIDSDRGIYINGGEICAGGNMFDHVAGGSASYAVFSFNGRMKGGSALTLKNEAGEAVAEWSPVNDFSYLVVSGQAVQPGSYTLWQNDVQLAFTGSSVTAFGGPGGMTPPEGFEPHEGMPEMPKGFDPSQMTPPDGFEMPEGMTPPEMPEDFDPSQMTPPEGFEIPEGKEHPEGRGFGGGRRGFGAGRRESEADGEQQTVFVITEEGGTFSGVSAAAE